MANNIKVTVKVLRQSWRKQGAETSWEITRKGKVTSYKTVGQLIQPHPGSDWAILNQVADKAVKLAKIAAPKEGEPLPDANGHFLIEAMPVYVTLVCDMQGKVLSKTQA